MRLRVFALNATLLVVGLVIVLPFFWMILSAF